MVKNNYVQLQISRRYSNETLSTKKIVERVICACWLKILNETTKLFVLIFLYVLYSLQILLLWYLWMKRYVMFSWKYDSCMIFIYDFNHITFVG